MQLYMCLIVVVTFITSVMAQNCDAPGYWGADCYKLCGRCLGGDNATCNKDTGVCTDESGCAQGYTGTTCMDPICDFDGSKSDSQCGTDNFCVAPDSCVCTGLTTRDENGKCYSLRVAGLKGAGISIVVLIVSILACQGGYKFVHSQN